MAVMHCSILSRAYPLLLTDGFMSRRTEQSPRDLSWIICAETLVVCVHRT